MPRRLDYTDRFRDGTSQRTSSFSGTPTTAQILAMVDRATSAERGAPDYALNLQIADYINEKKGSTPREVAMKLATLTHPSQARRALLALAVLDVCAKNCGYPFHLAISRRDFLNALIRSFTARPPMRYTHLQNVILGMLQEWDIGLVKHSKYRDDLVNISEMVKLLQRKGYIFPEVSMADVAALRPTDDSLKSAAELESEDREVQSAKLQELIRSGTPEDLQEANRLMSLMAGFRESRIDYHAKMAAELDKVRRKAELLSELLQQGDQETLRGDVAVDLYQAMKSALPKIKHILNDKETMDEDEEAKTKVLQLQSTVESVIEQYNAVQHSGAPRFASLIDIDSAVPPSYDDTAAAGNAGSDDLLGLTLGSLSLGPPPGSPPAPQTPTQPDLMATLSSTASPAPSDPFAEFTASVPSAALAPAGPAIELVKDDSIAVSYTVSKSAGETELQFQMSNPGSKKITNLETQFAPPRSLKLELGALSSTQIEPHQASPITQKVKLVGDAAPKLRWRISYNFGISPKSLGGDIKSI